MVHYLSLDKNSMLMPSRSHILQPLQIWKGTEILSFVSLLSLEHLETKKRVEPKSKITEQVDK